MRPRRYSINLTLDGWRLLLAPRAVPDWMVPFARMIDAAKKYVFSRPGLS